jgi:hypothetical protein
MGQSNVRRHVDGHRNWLDDFQAEREEAKGRRISRSARNSDEGPGGLAAESANPKTCRSDEISKI